MDLNFNNKLIQQYMYKGSFGLERENLRVDSNGFLSHTKHPFPDNPGISRDFCENQIEIITGADKSAKEAVSELKGLNAFAAKKLLTLETGSEYIWPFSNPPYVKGEEDIPVASFGASMANKSAYREYLAQKYGKMKMLFSGIHCNFSFAPEFIEAAYGESGFSTLREYKNALYLALAKKLAQYSWLFVYLTAASPVTDDSFINYSKTAIRYASPRCSEIGYWNDFIPLLSYNSLEDYVKSIEFYIDSGKLISPSELYYPIRLKPKGANKIDNLSANGINHIELRMFDVNPLSETGVFTEDIDFIQLTVLYLLSLKDIEMDVEAQKTAVYNMKAAAEFDDSNVFVQIDGGSKNIRAAAEEVLNNMESFFTSVSAPKEIISLIKYQQNKVIDPQKRYAVIIRDRFGQNYVEKGLELAKYYAKRCLTEAEP